MPDEYHPPPSIFRAAATFAAYAQGGRLRGADALNHRLTLIPRAGGAELAETGCGLANCVIYPTACDITDAANALAAEGHSPALPSMIISPWGEVLAETVSTGPEVLKITIEVNQTSNWHLGQRRDLSRL